MSESKFTYIIEAGDNNGFIWIAEKETKIESNDILCFDNEMALIESLKKYRKRYILVDYNTPEFLEEGKRLSKELNLEFLHP